jgi:GT2 family glycosyltransferase
MGTVGAVVVLYRMSDEQSPAVAAIQTSQVAASHSLFVVIHDNSEFPQQGNATSDFVDRRVVDSTNPGLARAYMTALDLVEEGGCSWLMLLDQDTRVTDAYLAEVLDLVGREEELAAAGVDILVPVLQHQGRQVSPHARPRLRSPAIHVTTHGPLPSSAWYYNSGLVLRTEAVRRVGGFPGSYPMDYLDHAMARRMRSRGSVAWQLGAVLEHDLSVLQTGSMTPFRLQSIFAAEERFTVDYGTMADRLWLVGRRLVLALLSVTGRRHSPSRSTEVRGVFSAVRVATTRRQVL